MADRSTTAKSQDPRKLRKLLGILKEYGVVKYRAGDIEIEISSPVDTADLELARAMYGGALPEVGEKEVATPAFSMDNYTSPGEVNIKSTEEIADDEILLWSAG